LSKLAQLELARADYSDDIDAGYRAMAADTEYNREANANSEDRDSANSEDRDSEAKMLTPKTGTPKLEMLTPKTGTPKLDIRFFCVK